MRDFEIRRLLKSHLFSEHREEPGTRILDELNLCQGNCRVDIAVVNGSLSGYEIKGPCDNLNRLPSQSSGYSKALDFVTLVVHEKYAAEVSELIPDWWGITVLRNSSRAPECFDEFAETLRGRQPNPSLDPLSVVQLLWKEEVLELLAEHGLKKGLSSKPRYYLWQVAVKEIELPHLCEAVRSALKNRDKWRGQVIGSLESSS